MCLQLVMQNLEQLREEGLDEAEVQNLVQQVIQVSGGINSELIQLSERVDYSQAAHLNSEAA